jgi:hypothetical protein
MVTRVFLKFLAIVCPLAMLAACAPGNRLHIPGDITRPPASGPAPVGPPQVAVWDFSYSAPAGSPDVIGRDYDQVREIVWKGDPGRAMADLVAGALSERGVPTVRLRAGDPAPENVPFLVSGAVRRFEVNARRGGVLSVLAEATVTLAVSASGPGVARPWETTVSSGTTLQDLFPVPEDLRKALLSAANTAAEEAVRRLREGGVPAAAAAEGKGGDGTAR